mmetsp:Transcript_41582/g.114577  ORF Transcript_41582/g.114577 Transcript_41582/m.114577 type:complete len:186 (-) Transcript_41582:299-856(-)
MSKEEAGHGGVLSTKALWTIYLTMLQRFPMPARCVTTMLMAGLGDIISQLMSVSVSSLDAERLLRFSLLNLVLTGPVISTWFSTLNALLPVPGFRGALVRLVPDQLVFAPLFNYVFLAALFCLSSGGLVGPSVDAWWAAMKANWTFWPLANLLNFWLVPPAFQMLFGNVSAIVWNVVLSSMSASA